MRDKLSTPKMGESVSLVILIAAASVTNAAVTWGEPPVNITSEGADAGFSVEGTENVFKYFFPEAHQDHSEDLVSVTKLTYIVRLNSQITFRTATRSRKLDLGSTRSNFYSRGLFNKQINLFILQNILSHQAAANPMLVY